VDYTSGEVPRPTLGSSPLALPGSRRRDETKGRIVQLDFIRGLAIFMVMSIHSGYQGSDSLSRLYVDIYSHIGWMGVDLFFVLSGFLVGGLLIRELIQTGDLRIKRFLLRRMFKIWPAYYCYIFFQICLRRHPLSSFLWQNVLNIQNYTGTSLEHTWSLAVEEHFYLITPFLLVNLWKRTALRSKALPILLACCAGVLVLRVIEVYRLHVQNLQTPSHTRLDGLLFGVILSYVSYVHPHAFTQLLKARVRLGLVCVAGLAFSFLVPNYRPLMWSVGYTVNYLWLASLLLLIYGYRGRLTKTWAYRGIAWVGLYSYGIYLWHISVHVPLERLFQHVPSNFRPQELLISEFASAIILGVVATKAIEFPMLRLRERFVPHTG
jgi:peptidoglycan/LPS O-acetylase OafA/YrhL